MNERWPQQSIFIDKVKQYCKENELLTPRGAVRLDIVSDLFNISESALRQFLQYKLRSRPHYDTLAYIAGVIGCPVTLFMDDPGDPPPGMPHEKWTEMTEQERVFASALLADVTTTELSLSEKEILFGAYQDLKARLLQLRKIWQPCKK